VFIQGADKFTQL